MLIFLGKKNRQEKVDDPPISSPKYVARFPLDVAITHEMAPLAKILVFYVTPSGETVADSVHIPVEECLENKVRFLKT